MINIEPDVADCHKGVFKALTQKRNSMDTHIFIGGRAGMKTQTISKFIIAFLLTNQNARCCIVRDQAVQLKNSILHSIRSKFGEVIAQAPQIQKIYEVQERQIRRVGSTPYDALFTFGMKGSSNDLKSRAKGIEGVDLLILEEAQDIRDYDQVRTLLDTVKRNNPVVVIMLNTPDQYHWVIDRYYNLLNTEYEEYSDITPKRADFKHYFTTYEDNPYLTDIQKEGYANYGDPNHPDYDLDYFLAEIKGYVSAGRKGRVFKDWGVCSVDEYKKIDFERIYGLDFGFTNDPTALVELKKHNKQLYAHELIYQTGLTNEMIFNKMCTLDIVDYAEIYCDSAEQKSIEELNVFAQRAGKSWIFKPAIKGQDSIRAGIQLLHQYTVITTDISVNIQQESLNYIYAVDRDGKPTNKPVDSFNHLMDAIRYPVFSTQNVINQQLELMQKLSF